MLLQQCLTDVFFLLQSGKCLYLPIPHMYSRRKDGAFKKITPPEDADERMLQLCATRRVSATNVCLGVTYLAKLT